MKKILAILSIMFWALQLNAQSSRYAETSVLSKGDWFKIQIDQSGVYKLTYEQLMELGIKNPANISVFGYGGAQLPESFLEPYIDDLPQLAIYMEKGGDGIFGKGDYILFYAQGPIKWEYNKNTKLFQHNQNTYSKNGYYFLTSDFASPKYIKESSKIESSPIEEITTFDNYYLYEKDEISLINTGRVFLGDEFRSQNLSRKYTINTSNIVKETAVLQLSVAHTAFAPSDIEINVDNTILGKATLQERPSNSIAATSINAKYEFVPKSNKINLKLTYSNSTSTAYLDYFTINYKSQLSKVAGSSLYFRSVDNIGTSGIYQYKLSNANSNIEIWNITDQRNVTKLPIKLSSTDLFFVDDKSILKEYIAIDPKSDRFLQPTIVGKVSNQDLHSLGQADMIIIAHSEFVDAAKRLAKAHLELEGLTTHVVTPDVIYNEFSSGTPDATAYRRFAKMFYDRSKEVGNKLKYLLLFGDGSFDNRQILKANTDKNIYRLLTYQVKESFDDITSYVTDDYFAFLDDTDGVYIVTNTMDVAVGRLPVYTVDQANGVVDKLIRYMKNEDLGPWKNQAIFLADDGDKNTHVETSDSVCCVFERQNPNILTRKLYLDSYTQEVTSVGEFYPTLKKEFYDYINSGTLYINYMGHSGYNNWTNEQILTIADINALYNERLPLVVTASCSFSRFDDFKESGGEVMLTNGRGGALALISAARTVYAQPNMLLNIEIAKNILSRNEQGGINTIGEALRLAKNRRSKSNDSNRLSFVLLGDPAIRLMAPETHIATIDSINGKDVVSVVDTVGALQHVRLSGSIRFVQDSIVDNTFNGLVTLTIFDKEEIIETLCNDAKTSDKDQKPFVYSYRTNPLYVGKAEVKNGQYVVEFIIPKDIRYNFGAGRIVIYASDSEQGIDANGYFSKMIIGGEDKNTILENDGPKLNIYLNTPYFVNGGKVDPNPIFTAQMSDISGINTIGSGIGHDIVLRIDNDPAQEYILNNYYESYVGSYTSGRVTYQLMNLPEGKHKLFFRAWDLQNNSSSAELDFEVVRELETTIYDVYAWPNPVSDILNLVVEHDKPLRPITLQLYIYDLYGNIVNFSSKNIVSNDLSRIDVQSDVSSYCSEGLYFARIVIIDENGEKSSKTTKIFVNKQ